MGNCVICLIIFVIITSMIIRSIITASIIAMFIGISISHYHHYCYYYYSQSLLATIIIIIFFYIVAADHLTRTMRIEKRYLEIEEYGVKLRLTIIDTPGYNDAIDSTDA